MIQEDRALWKYIVFGFLTCGIYNFYFIYKMAQDVNEMCADDGKKTSGLVVFILLSYLTCGIYTLIWYYSLATVWQRTHRVMDCSSRRTEPRFSCGIFSVCCYAELEHLSL